MCTPRTADGLGSRPVAGTSRPSWARRNAKIPFAWCPYTLRILAGDERAKEDMDAGTAVVASEVPHSPQKTASAGFGRLQRGHSIVVRAWYEVGPHPEVDAAFS